VQRSSVACCSSPWLAQPQLDLALAATELAPLAAAALATAGQAVQDLDRSRTCFPALASAGQAQQAVLAALGAAEVKDLDRSRNYLPALLWLAQPYKVAATVAALVAECA